MRAVLPDISPAPLRPCAFAFPFFCRQNRRFVLVRWNFASSFCFQEGNEMNENELSKKIVDAAVEVHRTLGGPGLLESVYEEALNWELTQAGIEVKRQLQLPIPYKGHVLATPLKLDLLVGGLVIVECKAASKFNELFEAQTLTYLRLTGLKLGLVINFGETMVRNGIHRVVNGL
jgi:GxxExxY protein